MAQYLEQEKTSMQKGAHSFTTNGKPAHGSPLDEVSMLLTQAGICCEEARQAAGRRRLQAACGLFSTAILLYKMLLRDEGMVRDDGLRRQIEEQMRHIENERQVHAELCTQWRHPRSD